MAEHTFVTYNMFKGNLPFCNQTVTRLAEEADFLSLQEWISSLEFKDTYSIATCETFTIPIRKVRTGTANISRSSIVSEVTLQSVDRELGYLTKKSMVLTRYHVDGKDLSVFNCHALNFVSNKLWQRTMDYWLRHVPETGSVIVAGDFNTWNGWRFDYLRKRLQNFGFAYASYEDNLLLRLDHIWTRDIKVLTTTAHLDTHTSDHYPVMMKFQL